MIISVKERSLTMNKALLDKRIKTFLGIHYYRLKRHVIWIFGRANFARQRRDIHLNYIHFSHSTPLLRKLKNVDMYLQHNKIVNLKIAAEKINGTVLFPEECFSYWKLIGKPTKKKGYLDGMILDNGKYKAGTGGGLCQMSNLIYWITLHTPLTVIERHRHGYDVFPDSNRTQPFGSGATCFYNYVDLMIKNNTPHPFQIFIQVTETDLEGYWASDTKKSYEYTIYEQNHRILSENFGRYIRCNEIWRKKHYMDTEYAENEFITENTGIMMYSPLIEKTM